MRKLLICFAIALAMGAGAVKAAMPEVRIAVLKFGTVNWVMDTIKRQGYDTAAGYRLVVRGYAGKAATTIAFEAGEVDLLVSDWFWGLRQRGKGRDLRFQPYSNALGALMVTPEITDLCAVRGRRIGIVGGKFDKSWLLYQALARRDCGAELAAGSEVLFGAPPLMVRQLRDGQLDAVSTFWHWSARMQAAGARRLIDAVGAMAKLDIAPTPAMIGYLWDRGRSDDAAITRFLVSVRNGQALLAHDDDAWRALKPRMKGLDAAARALLRRHYVAGVPRPWTPADTAAAGRLHALLIDQAPAAFKAQIGRFDPRLFTIPRP
ncbi:MAG: ABC transporter substrate-binding protein [Alphaproteobacteria bacterium]|nr:ABC transporter substrate-binding protein [Alphaproteobacteria bacterium]